MEKSDLDKKIYLLQELHYLKECGYDLPKNYTTSTPLDELEYDYELLKTQVEEKEHEEQTNHFNNLAKNIIEGLAFSVNNITNGKYDDIYEELITKYSGQEYYTCPPEIKIVSSLFEAFFSKLNGQPDQFDKLDESDESDKSNQNYPIDLDVENDVDEISL